jgi:hypothetical protein
MEYMPKWNSIVLASAEAEPQDGGASSSKRPEIMGLFAGLKKIRDLERAHLPFLRSLVDFDIVIEIGYAAEQDEPLTLKRLFLLNISSRTTVRRRLAKLIQEGVVTRQKHADDRRAAVLSISSSSHKIFGKYCGALTSVCSLGFE